VYLLQRRVMDNGETMWKGWRAIVCLKLAGRLVTGSRGPNFDSIEEK
jgi:hypothetical protein